MTLLANQTPIKVSRLPALDLFRGLTIVGMILVNSPGKTPAYSWLEHSNWNGCTLADLVFPFFIVMIGLSSSLALTSLEAKGHTKIELVKKIVLRSLYLFTLGLLLNAFPNHFSWDHLRILGVLQRLALCYLVSSLLFLYTRESLQVLLTLVLLLGYWLLMMGLSLSYPLTPENNLVGHIDKLIFGSEHLYRPYFDPEGLLSTLPALSSALLGNLLGFILLRTTQSNKNQSTIWLSGLGLASLGWLWGYVFPFNKALWSSSYVLWTGGLAYLTLAACFSLSKIKRFKTFEFLGQHSLSLYLLHVIGLKLQVLIHINDANHGVINLRLYLTEHCFGYLPTEQASLAYALSYTLFWFLVLKSYFNSKNKFFSKKSASLNFCKN